MVPSASAVQRNVPRFLRFTETLADSCLLLFFAALIWGNALAGCQGPSSDPPPSSSPNSARENSGATDAPGYGEECELETGCAKGRCVRFEDREGYGDQICTKNCKDDSDCPSAAPVCGVGPDGEGVCLTDCERLLWGATCIDGHQVACAAVSGSCIDCGCEESLRCDEPTGQCAPKGNVGEFCRSDVDCRTGNCGLNHNVCRTPVGSPCTVDDCDLCLQGDGWSFCSRECDSYASCNENNDLCLGDEELDYFYCRPSCSGSADPSCAECDFSTGGRRYCASTTILEPKRPLGSTCRSTAQCETGFCYAVAWYTGFDGWQQGEGYCTSACSSDTDCGNGLLCVDVPCVPGEVESCGPLCLRDCADPHVPSTFIDVCQVRDGSCRELAHVPGGESVKACDVRMRDGATCRDPESCTSGRCEDNQCFPSEAQPNGAACAGNADCQSGSCSGGRCRGAGLLGDACTNNADCAVGNCCDTMTCCN